MTQPINDTNSWQLRNKKNTLQLMYWTAAWVISLGITAFAPKFIWDFNTPLTIISVLINIAVGFGMVWANKTYLNGLDELQRKIQTDAMGLTLGVGLVMGNSYELLEDIHLIPFQPEIPHLVILMCLTYFIGMVIGKARYQ